jgi:hypothetical protein
MLVTGAWMEINVVDFIYVHKCVMTTGKENLFFGH